MEIILKSMNNLNIKEKNGYFLNIILNFYTKVMEIGNIELLIIVPKWLEQKIGVG